MIIVEREISAYTHHTIIVGIFENIEKADIAKETYIESCQSEDKWAEQAYRTVNLKEDVTIKDISELIEGDTEKIKDEVYVVSYFTEGFGQVMKTTEKVFTASTDANKYVEQKEVEEPEYEPSWYETKCIKLNKIYNED